MTLLRVCLVQVGAEEVIGGGCGQGRGHAVGQGPSAIASGIFCHGIWQHQAKALLIVQRHALQEVVQQLCRLSWVNSRAVGDKCVHVVHTLDVARCKSLTCFSVHGIHF